MNYKVIDVCEYIITYCNFADYGMSHLRLHLVLYFVQAEFLVSKNKKCFEEPILATSHGPEIEKVRSKYGVFGNAHIPRFSYPLDVLARIHWQDKRLIEKIVDACSIFTNTQLRQFIFNQDPWTNAYSPYTKNEIKTQDLKEFFYHGADRRNEIIDKVNAVGCINAMSPEEIQIELEKAYE